MLAIPRYLTPGLTFAICSLACVGSAKAAVLEQHVDIVDGFVTIAAQVESSALAPRAWQVLTDFDNLDRLLPPGNLLGGWNPDRSSRYELDINFWTIS